MNRTSTQRPARPRRSLPARRANLVTATLAGVLSRSILRFSTLRFLTLGFLALGGSVLGTSPLLGQSNSLAVAVSLPPQGWLVEQLGGEHVDAWSLLQPGDGPETYQPTDSEVTRAARADLLVLIGVPFERGAWARALRQRAGLQIVEPPEPESHQDDHGHDAPGHHHDPHVWLSPRRLQPHAKQITEALISLRPEAVDELTRRLEATSALLDKLHRQIEDILAGRRDAAFLVHHPSWTTFAEDFGLRQLAIESRGHEPSDAELSALLRTARAEAVRVLFVQPGFAGASRHAVAAALSARTEILDPLPRDLPEGLIEAARRIAAAGDSS